MFKKLSIAAICSLFSLVTISQVKDIRMPLKNTYEILSTDTKEDIISKAVHVVPTANQYAALRNEYIAFIHFGPNTFTRMEWGSGKEDPKVFDLKTLDTDQWCRVMKEAGMKMVIITAKHHDGFVLWQSRYTKHGIMSTGFQNGKGDIVKELSTSCKKYGLRLGIYLSPADLFQIENAEGLYGNLSTYTERIIPRNIPGRPFANKTTFTFKVDDYNEYFLNQLFELLTEYGPISEVWFDGAHPKTKGGQTYNYLAWKKLIQTLAPNAVIFGKQDIRWCGNEAGGTRATEWNTIAYPFNPDTANYFPDLTKASLGQRDDLYKAKYIHYQQAETNTSIREGWFYRDNTEQKVRSADDVFDIYERSVGGNSTFLLNIPPNREGRFSDRDVKALLDAGRRIKDTYGINLFKNAMGDAKILDNNPATFSLLKDNAAELIITMPSAITINRILLQESVTTHGERVEAHAVDAWTGNEWKKIAVATNIGYKRILRFPEVTASKFRIRFTQLRAAPAINRVAAFYYKTRPPQLQISSDVNGRITIAPQQHNFNWNHNGENAAANINSGIEIRYTTDGSVPTKNSRLYTQPFEMSKGEVKAVAFSKTETGSVAVEAISIAKKDWKVIDLSSESVRHKAAVALDANSKTYWLSEATGPAQYITIDLGKTYVLKGFAYTPQSVNDKGMMEKGAVHASADGKTWTTISNFEFGNLINDPTKRRHNFSTPVSAKYIKIESKEIAGKGNVLAIAELDLFE
ncbi:alpha-L-fucosidase [Niabella yanshanensis]|uniref:alpha-L-fucosidase n=1 Tax=Niabella yanshanensis TaxID=577386 RepID=A0ABZ0W069_9BACT|nr:alpha-L-fucosidase [Niabella yanshanensis]WQD36650.1 alpha-L-fucosidase [Niabella yanshanensis]